LGKDLIVTDRILELSRLGLDAVLREDWDAFDSVMLEREALMSGLHRGFPESLLSSLRYVDGLTIKELSKKRSETRAKLQAIRHTRGTPRASTYPRVKGFDIMA
jgi:hypothetical protein